MLLWWWCCLLVNACAKSLATHCDKQITLNVVHWMAYSTTLHNCPDIQRVSTEQISVALQSNSKCPLESTSTRQPASHALRMTNNHKVHTWMASAIGLISRPKQFPDQAVSLMPLRDQNDRPLSKLVPPRTSTNLEDSVFKLHVKQNAPHSTTMHWPMDSTSVMEHLQ